MKRYLAPLLGIGLFVAGLAVAPASTWALGLTIDQVIYQPSAGLDPSALSGTATATTSGNTLTIVLANTSSLTGGASGTLLLTGIGFSLPGGVTLSGGSATVTAGSTTIGFSGTNLSGEWGSGTAQSFFVDTAAGVVPGVNYASATQQALFLNGSPFDSSAYIANPQGTVGGPDFGLLGSAFPNSAAGGLYAVKNSLTLNWTFSGISESELLTAIQDGPVVLAFGSPSAVPEPTTLLLLGSGLLGIAAVARKKGSKKQVD
jgi:hypothetical protein